MTPQVISPSRGSFFWICQRFCPKRTAGHDEDTFASRTLAWLVTTGICCLELLSHQKHVQVHCYAVELRPITDSRWKTLSAAFHSLQRAHVHLSTHMLTRCVCPTSSARKCVGEREGKTACLCSCYKKLEVMPARVQMQVRELHSWFPMDIIFAHLLNTLTRATTPCCVLSLHILDLKVFYWPVERLELCYAVQKRSQ